MKRALLIAGPTASGKSAAALALAQRFGATIVNADSMQVYKDLRILTARPTPEEERLAPHRLFGAIDGAVNFSAGRWARAAREVLAEIGERPVIFVGGTGLYFRALTEGLSDIPPVPEAVRAAVRGKAEGRATVELHDELKARDPETAARLNASDRQRILRALEVMASTGRPLVSFLGARAKPALAPDEWAGLYLAPDRTELGQRIDARFDAMLAHGALDEVAALCSGGSIRRCRSCARTAFRISSAIFKAGLRLTRPRRARSSTPAITPSGSSPGRAISSAASNGRRRRRRWRRARGRLRGWECRRSG